MKIFCIVLTTLVASCMCARAMAGVLVTPHFAIVIAEQCAEGDVACNHVVYTGVNRKTGNALTLHGKVMVSMCADKVTPCHHLGWIFHNGAVTYTVTDEGTLSVTRKGKLIVQQQGTWVR